MGMFDSVGVPCPKCGEVFEAQSKSGPCFCNWYSIDAVPLDVAEDIDRHAPFTCKKCGNVFSVNAPSSGKEYLDLSGEVFNV